MAGNDKKGGIDNRPYEDVVILTAEKRRKGNHKLQKNKFYEYVLKVTPNRKYGDPYLVYRRYSAFDHFQSKLISLCPEMAKAMPALPPKKRVGRSSVLSVATEREPGLNAYLRALVVKSGIAREDVRQLVRSFLDVRVDDRREQDDGLLRASAKLAPSEAPPPSAAVARLTVTVPPPGAGPPAGRPTSPGPSGGGPRSPSVGNKPTAPPPQPPASPTKLARAAPGSRPVSMVMQGAGADAEFRSRTSSAPSTAKPTVAPPPPPGAGGGGGDSPHYHVYATVDEYDEQRYLILKKQADDDDEDDDDGDGCGPAGGTKVPVKEWTADQVVYWLGEHGFEDYETFFRDNKVSGRHLAMLKDDVLETKFHIEAFGDRADLLMLIQEAIKNGGYRFPPADDDDQ